jgi:hypothetical protein
MKSILVSFLFLIAWTQESKAPIHTPTKIPVDYSADRFIVQPVTTDDKVLRLFADTGGGLYLYNTTAKRLGLAPEEATIDGQKMKAVKLPRFKPKASIPSPQTTDGWMPVYPEQQFQLGNNISGMVGPGLVCRACLDL